MEEEISLAETKLKEIFGESASLKSLQKEALSQLFAGHSVFASLPTGYGKSLLYWLPALAWDWRVIVVSPLISLMEDQKITLDRLGISSVMIHSGMSEEERIAAEKCLFSAQVKICFLSPERISAWWENGKWARLASRGFFPDLIVLDEMHCLEDWREFRSSYQDFYEPVKRFLHQGSRLLGLSASFSRENCDLWMHEFLEKYVYVGTGLERNNLSLFVLPILEDSERWLYLLSALRELKHPEAAIIYCSSREECMEVAAWLRSAGILATAYHAGLSHFHREAISRSFRQGACSIICATSAFGMGIDYPHVSRVIHFSLPYDLESYWQEVGRAGRSGQEAYAICFWRRSEIVRLRSMNEKMQEKYSVFWRALVQTQLRGECRKIAVAKNFNFLQEPCEKCDRCRAKRPDFSPLWMNGWDALWKKCVWWLEKESEPINWLEEKILAYKKP